MFYKVALYMYNIYKIQPYQPEENFAKREFQLLLEKMIT